MPDTLSNLSMFLNERNVTQLLLALHPLTTAVCNIGILQHIRYTQDTDKKP